MIWDFLAWLLEFFTQHHREYDTLATPEHIPAQGSLWD